MTRRSPDLEFFDCNVSLGRPMNRPNGSFGEFPATADDLLRHMDRAGVRRALVWHRAQRDAGPEPGNGLLDEALAGRAPRLLGVCRTLPSADSKSRVPTDSSGKTARKLIDFRPKTAEKTRFCLEQPVEHGQKPCTNAKSDRLLGSWTFIPFQTRELGDADAFFAAAKKAGVRAFRAFPDLHRYLLRPEVVGEVVERLAAARAPLILRVSEVGWESVYNLLAACPDLTLILANMGVWNNDRLFRPLLERYPNVCIETSGHVTDGGIEAFVESYGPRRLLFGSGFPEAYIGSMMLAVAHAEIALADKRAIAGANLERLLAEVRL